MKGNSKCTWCARQSALCLQRYIAISALTSALHVHKGVTFRLSTTVCVNQVTFYSIFELKQCPRYRVLLKSIQHLLFSNYVISSDKIIVIVWLMHIFISKSFA